MDTTLMDRSTMEAGEELDRRVAVEVMGEDLTVPRERAMAIVGALYTRVTGPTFVLDVHGHDLTVRMPEGDTLPEHESDDNWNQRYFRHAVAELLEYPNEIGEMVARDVASIRLLARPYSTDISSAWGVMEHMARDWFVDLTRKHRTDGREVWSVSFDDGARAEYGEADTAPLAICRAALAVLTSETKGTR